MRNTPNLILRVWDNLMDHFNHTELAQNWDKIDAHDHTGSDKGLPIPQGGLAASAVDNPAIADGAVSTAKMENAAVTEPKLALGSVSTGRLADDSVTNQKLAPNAVTSSEVQNGSLTPSDLNFIPVQRGNTGTPLKVYGPFGAFEDYSDGGGAVTVNVGTGVAAGTVGSDWMVIGSRHWLNSGWGPQTGTEWTYRKSTDDSIIIDFHGSAGFYFQQVFFVVIRFT